MIRRGIEPLNGQDLAPTLYAWIEQAHELTLDIAANLFATYQYVLDRFFSVSLPNDLEQV